jgi:hypothetical protein
MWLTDWYHSAFAPANGVMNVLKEFSYAEQSLSSVRRLGVIKQQRVCEKSRGYFVYSDFEY